MLSLEGIIRSVSNKLYCCYGNLLEADVSHLTRFIQEMKFKVRS